MLGTKNLSEILSDREHTAHEMLQQLDLATDPWGIKVERVEVHFLSFFQSLNILIAEFL